MKYIEKKVGDTIRFISKTPNLGKAEFVFCPVFKYGFLRKIYITSMQQENPKNYFISIEGRVNVFDLADYTEAENARNWTGGWCKEHKTIFQRWYVSSGSSKIRIAPHFGDSITLEMS